MHELESYAFAGCSNLKKVVLPENDNMLGELLFTGCDNIEEIVCLSENPPVFDCNSPLFDPLENEILSRCRLIVLPESEQKFREAPVWSLFF